MFQNLLLHLVFLLSGEVLIGRVILDELAKLLHLDSFSDAKVFLNSKCCILMIVIIV
jgi:hypothetical protein